MEYILWYLLGFFITLLLATHLEVNDVTYRITFVNYVSITFLILIGWWLVIFPVVFSKDGYIKTIDEFLFRKRSLTKSSK
jgi:hypothetical protein